MRTYLKYELVQNNITKCKRENSTRGSRLLNYLSTDADENAGPETWSGESHKMSRLIHSASQRQPTFSFGGDHQKDTAVKKKKKKTLFKSHPLD